jgi:hypothetical protein|tara:strand:+ start:2006 stop:2281 length:276 start_codon:yes stop_codon:yes gene_type:complete
MTKLVEVYKQLSEYQLREVYVNPKHIVAMRQDDRMSSVLKEGQLPDQLDQRQTFTKLYVDRGNTGIDITVVGDLSTIKEKLGLDNRSLLKG